MANKKYKILEIDPWLEPFESDINLRMNKYYETRYDLVGENSLESFANGYMFFGFSRTKDGWIYREWAPGADEMHLIGDFNDWDRRAHPIVPNLVFGKLRLKVAIRLSMGKRLRYKSRDVDVNSIEFHFI